MQAHQASRPGARDLSVDVFAAEGDPARTAVILLHGGGWARGDRSAVHPYARQLAAAGFVAIAAEYRLLGEAAWPAQLQDVLDVIRWTRSNAEMLGVDPDKIVAEGFSAGGHLALLAAGGAGRELDLPAPEPSAASAALSAVVAFFAPVDLTASAFPRRPPPSVALLGPDGENEDQAALASPLRYASSDFPPTFLLTGLTDKFMPYTQTIRMFEALAQAGAKAELHIYHDHTHEFSPLPSMLAPVQAEVALFLNRAVVDPERYARENLELNPFAKGPPG